MNYLHGLLLAVTLGTLPASALAKEDPSNTKGTAMVTVNMETSAGTIKLELDGNKAPQTVENFVAYARDGHYDGTIFHRVIKGFMIQGGGFDENMQQKPTKMPIDNEAKNGLKNVAGAIAMARTNQPHSATAQFFINVKDNGFLDYPGQDGWGYCVFGRVTEGLDVVDKIKEVATITKMFHQDVPVDDIVIEKAVVEK